MGQYKIDCYDSWEKDQKFYGIKKHTLCLDRHPLFYVDQFFCGYIVVKLDPEKEGLLDDESFEFHKNRVPTILRYDEECFFVDRRTGMAWHGKVDPEEVGDCLIEWYGCPPDEAEESEGSEEN